MIVGVSATCHIQYTWDRSVCIFYLIEQHSKVFVTHLTAALYVHPLWFYKHQHDNRVRSKLFVACQWWWFQWRFWFVPSVPGYTQTHPVSCNCAYQVRMELSDGGCFPNLERNCRWTTVPWQSFEWSCIKYCFVCLFPVALRPNAGHDLLILEVSYHTERRNTVARTPMDEWSARRRDLYLTTNNNHNRQTSMSPVGFEPTVSASERP